MSIEYLILKYIHIFSSTLLFGTGLGSAFYKWRASKTGDTAAIAFAARNVVLADWIFTTPAVVIQPVTGITMALMSGWPLTTPWIALSLGLYAVAGACWIPVVFIQHKMRRLADEALEAGVPLTAEYHRAMQTWFWLGVPAFSSLLVVFWLMVAKPQL